MRHVMAQKSDEVRNTRHSAMLLFMLSVFLCVTYIVIYSILFHFICTETVCFEMFFVYLHSV